MPSTYSTNLKIELIALGEQVGTWGTTTNTNLGTALEQSIVGRATVTFATDANKTLTLSNTNAAQDARAVFLNLTSSVSLTVTRDLIVPAINKNYIVKNATTGSQSIRVIIGAGSVTIPNGNTALIYSDGTDITYQFDHVGALNVASALTVGGALTVTGTSSLNGNAAVTGTFSATGDGTFSGTGQVKLPAGANGDRSGSPVVGMVRYNTSLNQFEGYSGSSPAWKSIGGSALSNDTATSSNLYPVFAAATSGTAENLYTSNAKLLYKPSTGEFQSSVPVASNGIFVNSSTVSASYTIASGQNGMSVGPITIDSGVTVTVSSNQFWLIL